MKAEVEEQLDDNEECVDPIVEALDSLVQVETKLRCLGQLFINNGKCSSIEVGDDSKIIGLGAGAILFDCAEDLQTTRTRLDCAAVDGMLTVHVPDRP